MQESCARLNNPDSAYKVVEITENAVKNMTEPVKLPSPEDANLIDETDEEEFYDQINRVMNDYEFDSGNLDENDEDFEDKLHRLKDKLYENLKKIADFSLRKDKEEED